MKTYVYHLSPAFDYGTVVVVIVAKSQEDANAALRDSDIFKQKVNHPTWPLDDDSITRACEVLDGPGMTFSFYEA